MHGIASCKYSDIHLEIADMVYYERITFVVLSAISSSRADPTLEV